MTVAYLIKSPSRHFGFQCEPAVGLTFTNSVIDLTFLHNSIFNENLKVLVQQRTDELSVGHPTLWFLVFDEEAMDNAGLEKAWKYINKIGATLHPYTRMGQSFSYKNIWTFPNIPYNWRLTETYIKYNEKGDLDFLFWQNPDAPMVEEEGEQAWIVKGQQVSADFIAVIKNKTHLTQTHTVHLSIPGNPNVDVSPFHQKKSVVNQMAKSGFPIEDATHIYILELFNRAISTDEISLSTIALYQIVEVLLKAAEGDRLSKSELTGLQEYLADNAELSQFAERILSSTRNITLQTSAELLALGIAEVLGTDALKCVDHNDFPSWRRLRSKLAHPSQAIALTELEFVTAHKSLRDFCGAIVLEIGKRYSMSPE